MPKQATRLAVQKTYKLFIGGKFARSESGRIIAARDAEGKVLANYCRASRKDFRDAVRAARSAVAGWTKCSAYLRGQILYRAAEMLETRRRELESELSRLDSSAPRREVAAAIDRLVYYAGWTDKFSQILGSINPVATSHFNFTIPEPSGVVVALAPDEPALLGLVSIIAPIIASGNSVVALASAANALAPLTFSEIMATSDIPAGVFNLLAGDRAELASHFAGHMDVNAIVDGSGDEKIGAELQTGRAINVKRYIRRDVENYFAHDAENPYWILDTVEMKTAWHPIGL
ncbi:MAG TPA: aldehyde dehydrogenase family protein [Chthoniobacterales bacterium]|nr:aldehyde dehydrogenase family protein [Chthoniobacterales bacterium]